MRPDPARTLAVLLLITFTLWPAIVGAAGTRWVEAVGVGFIGGGADSASARRNAVAEALIAAGLAGGAEVRSYTVLDKARITEDFAVLRSTKRIYEHKVIEATQDGHMWRVRVRARVDEVAPDDCAPRRRLDVLAFAPEIAVDQAAPAWTVPLAEELFQEILRSVEHDRRARLTHVTDRRYDAVPAPGRAIFDYRSLTEGDVPRREGAHALLVELDVDTVTGREVTLTGRVALRAGNGEEIHLTLDNETHVPQRGTLARALGPDRRELVEDLSRGIVASVERMVARMACRAPVARLARAGPAFAVPLGRQHGLTTNSLGFAETGGRIAVFEIVHLGEERATLRPLDRSRPSAALAGQIVTFLEAG